MTINDKRTCSSAAKIFSIGSRHRKETDCIGVNSEIRNTYHTVPLTLPLNTISLSETARHGVRKS